MFHAGTIGSGPRLATDSKRVTDDQAEVNRRDLAGLVVRLETWTPCSDQILLQPGCLRVRGRKAPSNLRFFW